MDWFDGDCAPASPAALAAPGVRGEAGKACLRQAGLNTGGGNGREYFVWAGARVGQRMEGA